MEPGLFIRHNAIGYRMWAGVPTETPFSYFRPKVTSLHFICLANSPQFHRFIFLNVATFRKEVAEKVGIGFEFPTQSSVVAPNAPKKSTNLQ